MIRDRHVIVIVRRPNEYLDASGLLLVVALLRWSGIYEQVPKVSAEWSCIHVVASSVGGVLQPSGHTY
ncbi:hypothetical protein BI364_16440 [Acidihalobacter yilgarnensis]|uniref:Uncharacterized protein n=1 Tax=Acidihalobacter yilgarnensis TaxID=2819280 RepID=A0A1D8IS61_9GAMM|nr:hypothetical protein BI364_16440 [Acidihalobacter yilgarnensis]